MSLIIYIFMTLFSVPHIQALCCALESVSGEIEVWANRNHPWIVKKKKKNRRHGNGEMPHCPVQVQIFGQKDPIMVIQKKKKNPPNETLCIVWTNLDFCYNPAVCWTTTPNTSWCWHPYGPLWPFSQVQSIPAGVSQPNWSSSTWSVWLDSSLMTVREAACEFHTRPRAEFDRNEGVIQDVSERVMTTGGPQSHRCKMNNADFMGYL